MNTTASPSGFVCRCSAGWVDVFITNNDGSQSIRFCSTCGPDYIANRVLNPDTGATETTCVPASVCTNVNCGPSGYCVVNNATGTPRANCKCRYNFANAGEASAPCTACAPGYTNPAADSGLPPCSICATGYTAQGTYCFPTTNNPTCPVLCGSFGTCKQLDNGVYTCVCLERYMNDPQDPVRRPCSVCRDGVSDPTNSCTPPAPGNFTQCMDACRAKDPHSVCIAASASVGFLGFRCACAPRYVIDERGLCNRCAPGYYTAANGECVESRCPNGCNLGVCVGDFSTAVPSFKCVCPAGYSGPNCLTYTPPVTPCEGKCMSTEICATIRTALPAATGDAYQTVEVKRCICKRNLVDDIRADGTVVRCGKCADGWAGVDCLLPALVDQSACDRVVCPEPSTCHVLAKNASASEFVARCLCRDGTPFRPETRCGLVSDVPDASVCPALCPPNSECVRASYTATGTRCVCKKGFRPSQAPDGSTICIPERNPAECPMICPVDQICVSALDFSSSAVVQTPKCVCRSPNAYMNANGTCVCRPGFFGTLCGQVVNPCATFASRCPPRSVCVPVESTEDRSLSFKCICEGSFSGQDCSVDLCALRQTPCPEGTRCNKDGRCVCPLNQVLDANNRCVDRPREVPTGTVNSTCSDPARATCILPPPSREFNQTRDLPDDKEVVLPRPRGGDNKIDDFGINFRTNGGAIFAVCIRRQLGFVRNAGAVEIQIAIRVCLRLVALEIRQVGDNGAFTDDGVSLKNITIGQQGSDGSDARTRIMTTDISSPGIKAVKFVVGTLDGIVRLECFVANTSRAVEDTVTTPNNIHCNLFFSIPAVYYPSPRSKICFRLQADRGEVADGAEGVFSLKNDVDTSRLSFFPVRNGVTIATGADLSFENFAWVGNARVSVTYSAAVTNGGFVIRGCFNTFNPDEVKLDPSLGSSSGYDGTDNSAAPSASGSAPKNAGATNSSSVISFSAALSVMMLLASLLF